MFSKLYYAEELYNNWKTFVNLEHWTIILNQYFVPRLSYAFKITNTYKNLPKEILNYIVKSIDLSNIIFKAITEYYKQEHQETVENIRKELAIIDQKYTNTKSLSQMALRILLTTPGITSVLVGMRQEKYVDEVIKELKMNITVENPKNNWNKIYNTINKKFKNL